MDGLMKLLKVELLKIVDNIDAGNSNMDEEDMAQTIMALRQYSHKDELMTKYQACQFLGVSRATFDNLVANGELPKGEKKFAGDSSLFWEFKDLMAYRSRKAAKSS